VIIGLAATCQALKDPWGIFCGDTSCYDVLGVASDAVKGDIKRQYRALSLQWHPDKNKAAEAPAMFQKIAKVRIRL
jgi:curved DNA-binding protein CbpA